MPESSNTHIKYLLLFLLLLNEALQNCVKFNDADGTCLECKTETHLYAGKCYNKLRGCDEHKIKDQKALTFSCKTCIAGYGLLNQLCIREAVLKLMNGADAKSLNQNRGIGSEHSSYKQNITSSNTNASALSQNQQKNKEQPAKAQPKVDIKFPEVELISKAESQYYQMSEQLSKLVGELYPYLIGKKPIKINLTSDKFLLTYEDGSILYASPLQTQIKSIAQAANSRYAVIKISQNMAMRNFLIASQTYKFGQTSQTNLTLKMVINSKQKSKKIEVDLDFESGQIKPIYSAQCQKQKKLEPKLPQAMKKEYENFLPISYAQFKDKTTSMSTPETISRVKAIEDEKTTDIIYKVYYHGDGENEEYAEFKYKVDKNETEVLGYYIQGSDIFAALKNAEKNSKNSTSATNITNTINTVSTVSTLNAVNTVNSGATGSSENTANITNTINTTNTSNTANTANTVNTSNAANTVNTVSTTNTTNTANSTSSGNAINQGSQSNPQTQIFPASPNQNINFSSLLKPSQESQNVYPKLFSNSFNNFSIFNSFFSSQTLKPKLNLSSSAKNNDTIISYLKTKQQFADKIQKSYKLISFEYQISELRSQITYKLKLLIASATLYVNIIENVETKAMSQTYQLDPLQACMEVPSNDPIVSQLDQNLQKNVYSVFGGVAKWVSQYKIEDLNLEKYLIYYYNNQSKKYFYEISKTLPINSTKALYKVSKSGSVDRGYYFDKKQHENMMLTVTDTDFDSNLLANNGISAIMVPILNQLKQKYKSYLQNSLFISLLFNNTHYKLYATNKMATYEIVKKSDDFGFNSQINLIDSKYGYEVWPMGSRNGNVANINSPFYQKLQQALLKKSSTYISTSKQIYIKKINQSVYEIAFKTTVGYYGLTATIENANSEVLNLTTSPVRKITELEDQKVLPTCKPNIQILQISQKMCFKKVIGCYRQIANVCILCDAGLTLQANMKECRKACGFY